MWEIITTQGHRARDIKHESEATRIVHSLGITTLIAPGRYLVSDNRGERFVAEIHRQLSVAPVRPALPSYR